MIGSVIEVNPDAGHEHLVLIAVKSTPPLHPLTSETFKSIVFASLMAPEYHIPEPGEVSLNDTPKPVDSVTAMLLKSPCVTVTTIWNSSFA